MEARPKELFIYETEDGRTPFSEWMDTIEDNPKLYAIIMNRLERVERGLLGDCKAVGEGVSELRIDFGSGYRIYFGQDGDKIVILLLGGTVAARRHQNRKAVLEVLQCLRS